MFWDASGVLKSNLMISNLKRNHLGVVPLIPIIYEVAGIFMSAQGTHGLVAAKWGDAEEVQGTSWSVVYLQRWRHPDSAAPRRSPRGIAQRAETNLPPTLDKKLFGMSSCTQVTEHHYCSWLSRLTLVDLQKLHRAHDQPAPTVQSSVGMLRLLESTATHLWPKYLFLFTSIWNLGRSNDHYSLLLFVDRAAIKSVMRFWSF